MIAPVTELLQTKLFDLGGKPVTIGTVLVVGVILASAVVVTRVIRFLLHRALVRRGVADRRRMKSIERLISYATLVVATVVALETAGIDFSALIAAGAVFAVGIGLALQGIAVNFVSGIILLVEQSIKVDDIIEVDGQFCRVMDLGIRATRVRTLFEEDIILPNAVLVQQPIKNLTLHDSLVRISVLVGIATDSDIDVARTAMQAVAEAHPGADPAYPPLVLLHEFAASSLLYEISVWIHDPWAHRKHRSELREALLRALRAKSVVIANPQLDVHIDEPTRKVIAQLGRAA